VTPTLRARVSGLDEQLLRATRRRLGGTPAVAAARGLSHFGEHALGWLAVGAVGCLGRRRRAEWATGVAGVLAAHAAGVVVKRVVRRARPALTDLPVLGSVPSGLSFPSAHACSTAAAAVLYGPMLGRPVMLTALAGMAVSRVLLGVHHPSDVAAGVVVGGLTARATRAVLAGLGTA
jgi:membrane-associated phospholipid phosphatase